MIQFLMHNAADTVGVVVVENVKANETLTGWLMDGDQTIDIKVLDDVPIGHKLALCDIASGDTILKYGHDIGQAVADIPQGGHVHVHNLKTKRW
jgi:(2R)-sulfolactate sulfo-lyase subunit alpha